MRLLNIAESQAVLESVRRFLSDSSKSPFLFRKSWARIISGKEEGGFGWIAFNYLQKVIGSRRIDGILPYVVVEMGDFSDRTLKGGSRWHT
jgi:Golgi nucleoside diphosphatase